MSVKVIDIVYEVRNSRYFQCNNVMDTVILNIWIQIRETLGLY